MGMLYLQTGPSIGRFQARIGDTSDHDCRALTISTHERQRVTGILNQTELGISLGQLVVTSGRVQQELTGPDQMTLSYSSNVPYLPKAKAPRPE